MFLLILQFQIFRFSTNLRPSPKLFWLKTPEKGILENLWILQSSGPKVVINAKISCYCIFERVLEENCSKEFWEIPWNHTTLYILHCGNCTSRTNLVLKKVWSKNSQNSTVMILKEFFKRKFQMLRIIQFSKQLFSM